jgi:hypothetical protein
MSEQPVPYPPATASARGLGELHSQLRQLHALEMDLETLRSLAGDEVPVLAARALGEELAGQERRVLVAARKLAAVLEASEGGGDAG